jgi:hypothetical protein
MFWIILGFCCPGVVFFPLAVISNPQLVCVSGQPCGYAPPASEYALLSRAQQAAQDTRRGFCAQELRQDFNGGVTALGQNAFGS